MTLKPKDTCSVSYPEMDITVFSGDEQTHTLVSKIGSRTDVKHIVTLISYEIVPFKLKCQGWIRSRGRNSVEFDYTSNQGPHDTQIYWEFNLWISEPPPIPGACTTRTVEHAFLHSVTVGEQEVETRLRIIDRHHVDSDDIPDMIITVDGY